MDTAKKQAPAATFEQAVLKAKVAQICDHVGYHAITQDSSNILVDIYQRMIYHLGHQCKVAANNNRRVEPSIVDLIQAYDFVGVSIPSLQEHIETVKLPLLVDIQQDEPRPSNRIQRNLLVDDLLETEKNSHLEDGEDGENKAMSENGIEEDEKSNVPLLKDAYEEIVNKFPTCNPVTADKKIRLGGRILFVANTKLKISAPLPPEPVPSTSGIDSKLGRKKKRKEVEKKQKTSEISTRQVSPLKQTKGKRKKKISREFVLNEPTPEKELEPEEAKLKIEIEPDEEKNVKDVEEEQNRLEEEQKEREREIERENEEEKERDRKREEERDRELQKELEKEKVVKDKEKLRTKGRGRGKGREKEKVKSKEKEKVKEKEKYKTKGRGNKKNVTKKPKVIVTPLDPAIAEPPSFFPLLEVKVEEPEVVEPPPVVQPDPPSFSEPILPTKQPKTKKKKKSNNQFAIVTETVTKAEEREYFCPTCGGPDDGDVMVECDTCQEWYHLRCIGLKKVPEDHETWECDLCISKKKPAQKRPATPVEVIKVKIEAPEPVVSTPPPPTPAPAPPPVATGSTSQDDLCPECHLPDDGTLMIQCDDPFCAKWFHGKCVNLLEEPKEDESWFCKVCVDKQQSAFKRRRRAK